MSNIHVNFYVNVHFDFSRWWSIRLRLLNWFPLSRWSVSVTSSFSLLFYLLLSPSLPLCTVYYPSYHPLPFSFLSSTHSLWYRLHNFPLFAFSPILFLQFLFLPFSCWLIISSSSLLTKNRVSFSLPAFTFLVISFPSLPFHFLHNENNAFLSLLLISKSSLSCSDCNNPFSTSITTSSTA